MKMRKDLLIFGYVQEGIKAGFNSHEEAVEAALKYALKTLI